MGPTEICNAVKRFSATRWCRSFKDLQNVTQADVVELLSQLDDDGNGFFDFDEFVRLVHRLEEGEIVPSSASDSLSSTPLSSSSASPSVFDPSMFSAMLNYFQRYHTEDGAEASDSGDDDEETRIYQELFIQFDYMKQGLISPIQLMKTLESFGMECDLSLARAVVDKFDEEGKGGLNFKEFRLLMDGGVDVVAERQAALAKRWGFGGGGGL